jgi:hypothetical protein
MSDADWMAKTPSPVLLTRRRWRQWSEAHAQYLLHQLTLSNEGIVAFCRRRRICRQRLRYWQLQLRDRACAEKSSTFVEVLPPTSAPAHLVANAMAPHAGSPGLTITTGRGISIPVTHDTDLVLLRRVLEALS